LSPNLTSLGFNLLSGLSFSLYVNFFTNFNLINGVALHTSISQWKSILGQCQI
jgi:hypothetical protein